MWILQLSDLHVASSWRAARTRSRLLEEVALRVSDAGVAPGSLALVLCGDFIHKGDADGYPRAAEFVHELQTALIPFAPFCVMCPGNHDILATERPFEGYDAFAWSITRADELLFSSARTCSQYVRADTEFIVANSAYKGDKTCGRVDLPALRRLVRDPRAENRVIVMHHHVIPCEYDSDYGHGCSVLRNSFEVLDCAAKSGVAAILHGHLHMRSEVSVGGMRTAIIGAGSAGSGAQASAFQCNLLNVECGEVMFRRSYCFMLDPSGGTLHELSA